MVVALACAAASLTGCAVAAATADEAHRDFAGVLVTTQELVGRDWEVRDDPDSRACANSHGVAGLQAPALRVAAGASRAGSADAARAVAEQWTALGYEVTQTPTLAGPDVVEVQARGDEGEYLIFRASDQAMTLQGESACVASAER
ncbi:MAG: hypothetical protein LCH43_11640 [Actinobacteria bacterium]|nr:hypothetical protein [Actinomycetota bacterium]